MDGVTGTIGDKAVLTCDIATIQIRTWDYVIISFLEDDEEVLELASLDSSGQASISSASRWSHVSANSNVNDMHVAFSLTFNGLKCTDRRSYTCHLEGQHGGIQAQANISLLG